MDIREQKLLLIEKIAKEENADLLNDIEHLLDQNFNVKEEAVVYLTREEKEGVLQAFKDVIDGNIYSNDDVQKMMRTRFGHNDAD